MDAGGCGPHAGRNVIAAFCRAHYGGILTAAGRWSEAEIELVQAARHFDRGMSERRAAAIIRLADLRVRQGRLEEGTLLLEGLEQHSDAVRTLAALHLARGETTRARDLLERSTEGVDDEVPTVGESTMLGPLLAFTRRRLPRRGRPRRRRTGVPTPGQNRRSAARPVSEGCRRSREGASLRIFYSLPIVCGGTARAITQPMSQCSPRSEMGRPVSISAYVRHR